MSNAFSLFGELQADTGAFKRSLVDAEKHLKATEKEIESTEKAAKRLGQTSATTARQYQKLNEKIGEQRKKMSDAAEAFQKGDISAKRMASALTQVDRAGTGVNSRLKDMSARLSDVAARSSAIKALGSAFQSVGSQISSVGKSMTLALTLPIAGIGAAIIKAGAEYEQSLSLLKAVTKASEQQMATAATTAKQLGADLTLPATSAKDAALAMTELAKAGLNVDQAMAAAKGVLQLAAAGQIEEAKAAEIAANALNAFRLEANQTVRVADLLAAAANASSSEVSDIAQAMKQASALFANAKVPIEDLTAAISLMSNAGVKGSDAGTSLKTFLQRLQSPTDNAASAMQALGVSVFDSGGKMKDLSNIIGQFDTALSKLTDEQKAQAINQIFGADAARAASILFTEGTKGFEAIKKAVTETGAAADLAKAKTQGVAGSWEAIKSQLETIGITIFDAIKKPLADILQSIAGFGEKFGAVFENLSPQVQLASVAFVGLVAALGPALIVIGAIVSAIGTLITAFGAISASVSVGPVLLGIAAALAVIGTAAAAAYLAYTNNFGGIKDFTDRVAGQVVTAWNTATAELKALFDSSLQQITAFWEKNGADITKAAQKTFDFLKSIVQENIKSIELFWKNHGEQIKAIASTAWDAVKSVVSTAINVIANVIKLIAAVINGDWSKAWDAALNISLTTLNAMASVVRTGLNVIYNILKGVVSFIFNLKAEVFNAGLQVGKSIVDGIANGITSNLPTVKSAISSLMSLTVIGQAKSLLESRSPSKVFMRLGEDVVNGFVLGLTNNAPLVSAAIDSIFGAEIARLEATIAKKLSPKEAGEKAAQDRVAELTGKLSELRNAFAEIGLIQPPTFLERFAALLNDGDLAEQVAQVARAVGLTVDQFKRLVHLQGITEIGRDGRGASGRGGSDGGGIGTSTPAEALEKITEAAHAAGNTILDAIGAPPDIAVWDSFFGGLQIRLKQFKDSLPSIKVALGENIIDAFYGIGDILGRSIAQWDGTFSGFFKSVAQGFAQMAKQIIADLVRILVYKALLNLFGSVAGGLFGGAAGGGISTGIHEAGQAAASGFGAAGGGLASVGGFGGGAGGAGFAMAGATSNATTTNNFSPTINMQASGNAEQDRRTATMIKREIIAALRKEQRYNR